MDETLIVEFDGGSRGNPGPAGIGVVIRSADRTPLVTLGRFIGRATNNVAEYRALITALEQAKQLGARRLQVRGDSELIIRQLKGIYRVKHPDMRELYNAATELIHEFDHVEIGHNLRHKNELADKLANLAMDRKADVTDADESPLDKPTAVITEKGDRFGCHQCGGAIEVVKPSSIRPHQLKPFVCQCGKKMDRM